MNQLKTMISKTLKTSINILFLILILSGCNAPNQAREEEPIEAYLRAEINGELVEFEGVRATIGSRTPNWLSIHGRNYDNASPDITPHYLRELGSSQEYLNNNMEYNVMRVSLDHVLGLTGALFGEYDGDVELSLYEPIEDSMKNLS